jgi:hypothetical protein
VLCSALRIASAERKKPSSTLDARRLFPDEQLPELIVGDRLREVIVEARLARTTLVLPGWP